MKTLIIGGGSIGYKLAELLQGEVRVVSRSNGCDIARPNQVQEAVSGFEPDTVVVSAGSYPELAEIGQIKDWREIANLIVAKTLGAMVVLDAAVKCGVKKIIVLGGSEVSGDPRFVHFTVGNGGLWAACQFASLHTRLEVYYLELGVVSGSEMGEAYVTSLTVEKQAKVREMAVSYEDIANEIARIQGGEIPAGSRVQINRGTL